MKILNWIGILILTLLFAFSFIVCDSNPDNETQSIKIALITMDIVDVHWAKMNKGAQDMAKELKNSLNTSIIVTWQGCKPDNISVTAQEALIDASIKKQADIIMLAPLSYEGMVPAIQRAKNAGIKIVLVDAGANTDVYDSFLKTDNAEAAKLAADELASFIGESGKVAIINVQSDGETVTSRENAFKTRIKEKYPAIEIVGTKYCEGNPEIAFVLANEFMDLHNDLVGFYSCNEGATIGTGKAIKDAGKAGVIHFVGFDWSSEIKDLVETGILDAAIVQNPYQMGYLGVKTAIDILHDNPFEREIDTGVIIATTENADTIN